MGFSGQSSPECQANGQAASLSSRPSTCGMTVSQGLNGKPIYENVVLIALHNNAPPGYLSDHNLVEPVSEIAYRVRCSENNNQILDVGRKSGWQTVLKATPEVQ